MTPEDRVDLHRRMAEAYRDAYLRQEVGDRATYYDVWRFTDDARYSSPYFTGNATVLLRDVMDSQALVSSMEAKAYQVNFPDWRPASFTYWAAENGFAGRVRWEGHDPQGVLRGFWSITFVETDDEGLISSWQTHVNGEEYGPFLEIAIGTSGPFDADGYVGALTKHLEAHGLV